MFAVIALISLTVLGANYGVNRLLKYEGIKYSHNFDDEVAETLGKFIYKYIFLI